ncbi:MAG: hypothetical protein ACK4WH_00975 [Phycisphaerales bacterium]
MNRTNFACVLILMSALGGACGVAGMNEHELAASDGRSVLVGYGEAKTGMYGRENVKLRTELERRSWFTDDEWRRIDAGQLQIGDRGDVMVASWGIPDRKSSFLDAHGKDEVFTYHFATVVVRNGRVTAINRYGR